MRCALTGIRFMSKSTRSSAFNPYAPSIDRIDATKGYARENVRLVIWAINLMLCDWGEATFSNVARSYIHNRTKLARNLAEPSGGNPPHLRRRKTK